MDVTWESIQEEFALFGSTFTDDVLPERCIYLCKNYKWQASDFYDEWLAWSHNKTEVTDEDLEKMIADFAKKKIAPKTPKTAPKRPPASPAVVSTPKRKSRAENILSASFTDGSESTPARVYKSGKRTGQIVVSHQGQKFTSGSNAKTIEIKVVNDLEMSGRLQNKDRATIILAALERLGRLKENFPQSETSLLKDFGGGNFVENGDLVYGMMRAPKKENMPFALFGDYETSRSASTAVFPKIVTFPGEVILGRIGNSAGQAKFVDEQILPSLPPLPDKLPSCTGGTVRLVVAAGPYTTTDTLSYEPYHDFVKKISSEEPHALVMMGPFVDRNHKKLSTNLDGTFEEFFLGLINYLREQFNGKRTQIFIVANHRENHTASRAFPTEKYESLKSGGNVTCLNDPSILDVNGIQMGFSSTDIFRALSDSMVNVDDSVDVIQLSAQKLLQQRSFYPVFPSANSEIILRAALLNQTMFDVSPHLFVLPATVAPFVRTEHKSMFLNPGTLVKGMDAGSYGFIEIGPFKEGSQCIEDFTKIQVLKI